MSWYYANPKNCLVHPGHRQSSYAERAREQHEECIDRQHRKPLEAPDHLQPSSVDRPDSYADPSVKRCPHELLLGDWSQEEEELRAWAYCFYPERECPKDWNCSLEAPKPHNLHHCQVPPESGAGYQRKAPPTASRSGGCTAGLRTEPHAHGAEIIIDGTVAIPANKPDIETLLRFTPHCRIMHWHTLHPQGEPNTVVFGVAVADIEYVASLSQRPVHSAQFVFPFHHVLLSQREVVDVRCQIACASHELVDQRTIDKTIVLHVCAIEK